MLTVWLFAQGFPGWQVLVVDLRCHGESAALGTLPGEPHSVHTSAGDVLALLRQLKLFPEVLVGHSFGGKVVMSMAEQFSNITSRLPRPVQVGTPSCDQVLEAPVTSLEPGRDCKHLDVLYRQ